MHHNQLEKNSMEFYKIISKEAIEYARGYAKISATHSSLHKDIAYKHNEIIIKLRDEYSNNHYKSYDDRLANLFHISMDALSYESHSNIRRMKKSIKKFTAGNCGELCDLTFWYLRKHNIQAEKVEITNGNHVFVVINRNPNSDINDPSTWGEEAILCDPLYERVYSVKNIKENLFGFRHDKSLEYPNIDIPYDEIDQGKPIFKVLNSVNKSNLEEAKSIYNVSLNKIDQFTNMLNNIKLLNNNKKEEILNMFAIFKKEFNPEYGLTQDSWHHIERQFHKKIKRGVRILLEGFSSENEAKKSIEPYLSKTLSQLKWNDQNNNYFITQLLLAGASPNIARQNGQTMLMVAVDSGNILLTDLLLKYGADPCAKDHEGFLAIHYSKDYYISDIISKNLNDRLYALNWVDLKNTQYIIQLIEAGASPNLENFNGQTLLMAAVDSGNTHLVHMLYAYGADLTLKDNQGYTTLSYAKTEFMANSLKKYLNEKLSDLLWNYPNSTPYIINLINAGASPNLTRNNGESILMAAVQSNNIELVKFLKNHGADVSLQDNSGKKAIDYTNNNSPIYSLLTENKQQQSSVLMPNLLFNQPCTPQQELNQYINYELEEILGIKVAWLVMKGAHPDTISKKHNMSLLMIAAKTNNAALVENLLASGANPSLTDGNGHTALHYAKNEYIQSLIMKYQNKDGPYFSKNK